MKISTSTLLAIVLFFTIAVFPILFFEKGAEILWFSAHHLPALDFLFKYITQIAEWKGIVTFGLLLLFWCGRKALVVYVLALLFVSISVNVLKHLVFMHAPRPADFFHDVTLNFVPAVEVLHQHSFPSGHTATAFAMACVCCFFLRQKYWQAAFIFMAVLVGFSRIYLLQHFYADVVAGAALGVCVAGVVYFALIKFLWSKE